MTIDVPVWFLYVLVGWMGMDVLHKLLKLVLWFMHRFLVLE